MEAINEATKKTPASNDNMKYLLIDVGLPGQMTTKICTLYWEYKRGASGLDSVDAQVERIEHMISMSKNLMINKEFIILGDINIRYIRINY